MTLCFMIYCTLYRNAELANRSFNESQKASPDSAPAWVGQATLAQHQQMDEEAMDLFRHAAFLSGEPESGAGYAAWVCRTLKAMTRDKSTVKSHNRYCVEKMHGSTVAVDCLQRCARRNPVSY